MASIHVRIPRRLAVVIAAALPLVLAGCSEKKQEGRQAGPPTVPVTVAKAVQKSMPVQLSSIGTVEPYSTVAVKAQISGQVTAVHFSEGQDVKKGDLLFTIDARPFEAELQRAIATLAKDDAQLANARAQATRYQQLQKEGVVAREQAETVVTNAQALEAVVNADRAAVEATRVQLQYCRIFAPISGRTGHVEVKAGNLVRANDTTPMVTINQITPIYASFTVPEQSLGDIKRFMARGQLRVSAQAPGQPPVEGALTFVNNTVDPTTGTIELKATFENTRRYLWPGQFVTTVLTLNQETNATVVPAQAVLNGQQGTYVYVLKSDLTTESRVVAVERTAGQEAVIRSGVNPGETVITDGQLRLAPGSRVEVKSAGPGGTTPAPAAQGEEPARAARPRSSVAPARTAEAAQAGQRPARAEGGQ